MWGEKAPDAESSPASLRELVRSLDLILQCETEYAAEPAMIVGNAWEENVVEMYGGITITKSWQAASETRVPAPTYSTKCLVTESSPGFQGSHSPVPAGIPVGIFLRLNESCDTCLEAFWLFYLCSYLSGSPALSSCSG